MLVAIQKGEAEGIICWKLDRLARNPIDGGNINWMLQQGVISSIITSDRSYDPNDNVLMMSVEFGMANQFIRDLGKNSKRGMVSKVEKGWLPALAPLGYLNFNNCPQGERYIIKDDERFHLVRKMWELMLTGQYSIQKICNIANDQWGLRTVKRKKVGGVKISVSTLYGIFTNSFYCGEFVWSGKVYQGKHEAMITKEEFDTVQSLLGKKGRPRVSEKDFPYRGLMQCGECGCQITCEKKYKYNKTLNAVKSYTYYHCTRKKKNYKCRQKSLESAKLEAQFDHFLGNMAIEDEFIEWIIEYMHEFNANESIDRTAISKGLKKELSSCEAKLDKLIELKISDLITDEEFLAKKHPLVVQKKNIINQLEKVNERQNNWIETAEKACNFIRSIKQKFNEGSNDDKRLILSTLGSNFILKDEILSLEAKGIFKYLEKGIIETKQLGLRLEPAKGSLNKTKSPQNEALVSVWYPRQESNLRPLA